MLFAGKQLRYNAFDVISFLIKELTAFFKTIYLSVNWMYVQFVGFFGGFSINESRTATF